MHPTRSALAATFLAAAALAGCSGAPAVPTIPLDPPRLEVDSYLPESFDAEGVTIAVQGRFENPNPVSLRVPAFGYALDVDGRRVASGQIGSRIVLPARGATPVRIPVRLLWVDVPGFVAILATEDALPFHLSGHAVVPLNGRSLQLPWAVDGRVTLPRLPALALEDAAVRDSGPLQTTMELRFAVRNPNAFPLPLGRFAYDLRLSGVSVVRAASHSLAAVPAGATATVVVPVRFSTIGVAAGALTGALRGGRQELALTGRAGYGALEVAVDARTELAP